MGGIFIALQLIRYLSCNYYFMLSAGWNSVCEKIAELFSDRVATNIKYNVDYMRDNIHLCDHWNRIILFPQAISLIGWIQPKLYFI